MLPKNITSTKGFYITDYGTEQDISTAYLASLYLKTAQTKPMIITLKNKTKPNKQKIKTHRTKTQ